MWAWLSALKHTQHKGKNPRKCRATQKAPWADGFLQEDEAIETVGAVGRDSRADDLCHFGVFCLDYGSVANGSQASKREVLWLQFDGGGCNSRKIDFLRRLPVGLTCWT
ncbi:methionine aminopeptidase 2-2 [Striga asiatica]|uniref:Methionine aminopeptidase 2-2 n=1 Tax=Striga asiatica TaxID=4170 RepID=A0A5A7P8H4_STRAF|nr:methionine aminopeptidase 2-2 [Striga asiatica]